MPPARPIKPIDRFAVIGAGAWGTALAIVAVRAGASASLWVRNPTLAGRIAETRTNQTYLPDHILPDVVQVTADLAMAVRDVDALVLAVPSQAVRDIGGEVHRVASPGVPVVLAGKGVERISGKLLSDVLGEVMPGRQVAVLSGPSFASEVAAGHPTAVTIASADVAEDPEGALATRLALGLATESFRPYMSDDVVGVEIAGAVKNVVAIACGIARGLGFGSNTWAALITRGLAEVAALVTALGGRSETVSGLSGMGDLALTCSSEQSRNFAFGLALGRGEAKEDLLAGRRSVVEGAVNAVSVTDLARRCDVEMPICEAVRAIVVEDAAIADAIGRLLERPLKAEAGAGTVRIGRTRRSADADGQNEGKDHDRV